MTKRTIILVTTAVLVISVLMLATVLRSKSPVSSNAVNALVATGISVIADEPLVTELQAVITDGNGRYIKTVVLDKSANRFNIDLPSGIYSITISSKDNSIPPFPTETITVSDGILSELLISIPHAEEK